MPKPKSLTVNRITKSYTEWSREIGGYPDKVRDMVRKRGKFYAINKIRESLNLPKPKTVREVANAAVEAGMTYGDYSEAMRLYAG